MLWAVIALSGCGWLLEVPEEQIPVRAPETTGNRVAYQRGGDAA